MVYSYKVMVASTVHHIGANVQWSNHDFVGFVIKFKKIMNTNVC